MSTSSEASDIHQEFFGVDDTSNDSDNNLLTTDHPNERDGQPQNKTRKQDQKSRYNTGNFNSFLAPFTTCCLTSSPLLFSTHSPPNRNRDDSISAARQSILQREESLDDPSTETSTDPEEISSITTPQIVDLSNIHQKYSDSKEGLPHDELDEEVCNALSKHGLSAKQLCRTSKLDSSARRVVSISLLTALRSPLVSYSDNQLRYIALRWCSHLEHNKPINLITLEKLISDKTPPKSIPIEQALKQEEYMFSMEFVRLVETRIIEEIMGEVQSAAAVATNTVSIYFIISNVRTVVISCRQQGEALFVYIFDTGLSLSRGPAFLAFNSIQDTANFLIALYKTDPLVLLSTQKFKAWILSTRYVMYTDQPDKMQNLQDQRSISDSSDSSRILGSVDDMDPKRDAKNVYANMYKATQWEESEKHNTFTHSITGGVDVQKTSKH